jgi:hypothetical protein
MINVARYFLSLGMALCATFANAAVEMKIVTTTGFVAFTVGDNWSVLSMQPRLPIAAGVFQIPDSADVGTKDSTNLIVMLFQADSEKAREKFDSPIKRLGDGDPENESFDDWTIYRQQAKQGDTLYSILDAKRKGVADVWVSVRLAWPHLGSNSDGYNVEMEALFRTFLRSIRWGLGSYVPRDDEVIRRPVK